LAHSQGTFFFVTVGAIAVSFVGPTSGNLMLRLRHRSRIDSTDLTVTGTPFQLSLSSSLTVDDITLHASPSESDKPSFEPGVRSNLIINTTGSYSVYDIQLLDQKGYRYDAASQSSEGVSTARCVLMSIMIDPLHPNNASRRILQCYSLKMQYIRRPSKSSGHICLSLLLGHHRSLVHGADIRKSHPEANTSLVR